MKQLISFKLATNALLTFFFLYSVFHLGILIGIIFFDYAPVDYLWGGRMKTKEELFVFEIISLLTMIFSAFVVLIYTKRIQFPKLLFASKIFIWLFFILFLLNTVGNVFAKSDFEKYFTIVTAISAILFLRLGLEKSNS